MHDRSIPLGIFVTFTLWAVVAVLVLSAWLAWSSGAGSVSGLLGATACAISACAATAHVRLYAMSVCATVRRTRCQCDPELMAAPRSLR